MAVVGAGELDHPVHATSRRRDRRPGPRLRRMTRSLRENIGQLERTQAQLVQSEKLASIGEMSAAVAHGLRNPLASLRAAAQLVRRHPDVALRHASTSTPSSRRWTGSTGGSATCSASAGRRRSTRCREHLPRLVEELLPAVAEPVREQPDRSRARAARRPPAGAGRPDAAGAGDAGGRLQRARRHAGAEAPCDSRAQRGQRRAGARRWWSSR